MLHSLVPRPPPSLGPAQFFVAYNMWGEPGNKARCFIGQVPSLHLFLYRRPSVGRTSFGRHKSLEVKVEHPPPHSRWLCWWWETTRGWNDDWGSGWGLNAGHWSVSCTSWTPQIRLPSPWNQLGNVTAQHSVTQYNISVTWCNTVQHGLTQCNMVWQCNMV